MGQVRTAYIKNLAIDLLENYPDKFSKDFNKNKEVLNELMKTESKKIRNTLAGYISHTVKKMENLHTLKVSYQPPLPERRGRRRRRKKR